MADALISLADADLRELIAALRSGRLAPPYTSMSLSRLLASSVAENLAADLNALAQRGLSGDGLTAALELLTRDGAGRAADGLVELVTSGPEAPGIVNRDTSVVVRELFAHAETSVLVAGYAVYQGQKVFRALAERMAARPDLRVQMFLDVKRGAGDTTISAQLVRRFAERFQARDWPAGARLPEIYYDPRSLEERSGKRASLHAKCVVVDGLHVFVSSANFTEAAQERNIEVGLLVRSHRLAEQIERYFEALVVEHLVENVS